jgi:hypothetical protein
MSSFFYLEDYLDPRPRKTDVVGYNQLRRIPA